MPKPLKVPSLARSVPKPLKVPTLARSVPKPLKVPSKKKLIMFQIFSILFEIFSIFLKWGNTFPCSRIFQPPGSQAGRQDVLYSGSGSYCNAPLWGPV